MAEAAWIALMRVITVLGILAVGILIVERRNAHADDAPPHRCALAKNFHDRVDALGGDWKELSKDQWAFLRGVYVMAPTTPPGLPFGDRVALATTPDGAAMLFFLDGDQACTPMPAGDELLEMLKKVGSGVVPHQGDGT